MATINFKTNQSFFNKLNNLLKTNNQLKKSAKKLEHTLSTSSNENSTKIK